MMAPTLSVGAEFDAFGRCVPADNLFSAHAESRRYFRLAKTDIDITSAYRRLIAHLPAPISVSEQAFVNRIARLQKRLATDNCTANLLNGLGVPFLLPKTLVSEIGTLFGEAYLPSVKAAFEVDRPTSRFVNHAPPGLAGKLSVQPGSRHERLIQAMERDDVVGLYFPCLSEYSLPAAVHRVSLLPEYFWLAGGFDSARPAGSYRWVSSSALAQWVGDGQAQHGLPLRGLWSRSHIQPSSASWPRS